MSNELKNRTKQFALTIIEFVGQLPKNQPANIIGKQLLRSATSLGANYRSACRARSRADFIAKMGIVEEETDESMYWLELLTESKIIKPASADKLYKEANEILSIIVSSIKTAKNNKI